MLFEFLRDIGKMERRRRRAKEILLLTYSAPLRKSDREKCVNNHFASNTVPSILRLVNNEKRSTKGD